MRRPSDGLMWPRQRGLSLVELMVALVAGLLIIASVGQVLVGSKGSNRMGEQLSRAQENARLAFSFLAHDLRLVANMGCASRLSRNQLVVLANPPLLNPHLVPLVSGGDNAAGNSFTDPSPAISTTVGAGRVLTNVVNGTDAITIQFAEPIQRPCRGNLQATLATVNPDAAIYPNGVPAGCSLPLGQTVMLSDCSMVHIFRVSDNDSRNTAQGLEVATATATLGNSYNADGTSEVRLFRSYTYFIRLNNSNPAQPSLYRLDNNIAVDADNPTELVEGVEDMQILYGLDGAASNDGAADQYFTAQQIAAAGLDWQKVVSLRITLTARSLEDNITQASRVYAGTDSTDHRLVYDSVNVVSIRNRLQ